LLGNLALRGCRRDARISRIFCGKANGLKMGSGFILGLPGTTLEDNASDILLMKDMSLDMGSVSPFIPADGTPLRGEIAGDLVHTLNAMAIMRLIMPKMAIPSVSALSLLGPDGQKLGLMAGGSVLTANFTPSQERGQYHIYRKDRNTPKLKDLVTLCKEMGLVTDLLNT